MTPEEEVKVATFFATPEFREIRPLLEQIAPGAPAAIDAVVRKVRIEVWRDFSNRETTA